MLKDMKKLFLFFIYLISILPAICQTTILMEKKEDVYYVPGEINGVPLKFIFDTGASNVYLSLTEALFMLKNGYLSEKDFGNTSYSQIANGDIVENTEVLLKEVKVGPIVLNNVKAMVSNTISAPLLLGQSAIQKLGPIQLDGNKLIIANGGNLPSEEKGMNFYQKSFQAVEAGKYEDAIRFAEEGLKYAQKPSLRAYLYENIAWAYKEMNDNDKAIEFIYKALGEDMYVDQPAYNLGVFLYDAKRVEEALRAFDNFTHRFPKPSHIELLADAYAYKGTCHSDLGQYKEAEDAFRKSIELGSSSQAYFGIADICLQNERYDEAAINYKKGLEYEPNRLSNIKRWHQLGFSYVKSRNNNEARNSFNKSIETYEGNKNIILEALNSEDYEFAMLCLTLTHYACDSQIWIARLSRSAQEAVKEYEVAFNCPEGDDNFVPEDYVRWLMACSSLDNPVIGKRKGLEICSKGLNRFPNNPDILFGQSMILNDTDSKGLESLYKILEQEFDYNPISFDYATVYNNIAWRLHLNNKSKDALTYSETAVRKDPTHDYSWETLGEIYYALGRYQDCINSMTKCIELNGDSKKSAYEFRAKAYQNIGKKKDAKNDLEMAKQL